MARRWRATTKWPRIHHTRAIAFKSTGRAIKSGRARCDIDGRASSLHRHDLYGNRNQLRVSRYAESVLHSWRIYRRNKIRKCSVKVAAFNPISSRVCATFHSTTARELIKTSLLRHGERRGWMAGDRE